MISIIIPVYNAEKFLPKCIESVLSQTYETFELILINDGSSDTSAEICASYAEKDSRVKTINQKNAGVSAARNRGIDEAKGEYICFIDADDWVDPDYLLKYVSVLEEKLPDFIVSGYTYEYLAKNKTVEFSIPSVDARLYEEIRHLLPLLHDNNLIVSIWSKLFKSEIIKKNSIEFDISLSYWEDVIFCWNYLYHANSISILKNAGYHYRKDDTTSLTKKKYDFDQWYHIATKVYSANLQVINKYLLNENKQLLQKVNDYFLSMFFTACYSMYNKEFHKDRDFRLERWKVYASHEFFRIKPEESLYPKFIKKLLFLKQFRLVDLLMLIRSKIIKS